MASITTKRGDAGMSDLMGGLRAPKGAPIFDALGDLDEFSCALGLVRIRAKAQSDLPWLDETLHQIQLDLIVAMGDLANYPRGVRDEVPWNFKLESLDLIDLRLKEHEATALETARLRGWALPGSQGKELGAQLDFARAVCRRAERSVFKIFSAEPAPNGAETWVFPKYLNRLSDLLWVLARLSERADS